MEKGERVMLLFTLATLFLIPVALAAAIDAHNRKEQMQ